MATSETIAIENAHMPPLMDGLATLRKAIEITAQEKRQQRH